MASTIRRRPNCFNLLFQMRLSQRMNREDATSIEAFCFRCVADDTLMSSHLLSIEPDAHLYIK